ncbi:MAG: DUF423 domain-containing protein [Elusimicrobia bacterium]|nr:DUF423 domain-containing protein [Elusimicrobiota bacterium]
MSPALTFRAGAAGMLLAVAFGAFGAHALRGRLDSDMLAVFETGVRYQAYHALALLALAGLAAQLDPRAASGAAACFAGGILLFSGSLYALALTGVRKLGAITPLGGVLLLAGWAWLLAGGWKR